jgi:ribosomal protein L29
MKFKEMMNMGAEEQEKKLKELELELIKLNAQVATGTPPKNAGQLKRLKKDIAKIMFLKSSKGKGFVKAKPVPKPVQKESEKATKKAVKK